MTQDVTTEPHDDQARSPDQDGGAQPPTIDVTQWRDVAEARLEQVRGWARANPIAAVGIALGAGFVIGRMLRR